MKQIKAGKQPDETPRHWFAGKVVTCPRCKREQELEVSDKPIRDSIERRPLRGGFLREAWFACPTIIPGNPLESREKWTCGGEIYVSINEL